MPTDTQLAAPETAPLAGRRLDDYPTPQEVTDFMAEQGIAAGSEAETELKLSALFGGQTVAVRRENGTITIFHVCPSDDVMTWVWTLSEGQCQSITDFLGPPPWDAVVAERRRARRGPALGRMRSSILSLFGLTS